MRAKGRGAEVSERGEVQVMNTDTLSQPAVTRKPSSPAVAPAVRAETPLLTKILVPVDLSEPALKAVDYAVALAGPARASVQLTYVVEPVSYFSTLDTLPVVENEEEIRLRSEELLARVAEGSRFCGVMPESGVRTGLPAEVILSLSRELPADLIVISTHGRTGLKRVMMGSIAEKILRGADCPVLVARKGERDLAEWPGDRPQKLRFRKILVPTDFSASSAETVAYAVRFAQGYGGHISLFHSIRYPAIGWDDNAGPGEATLRRIQTETAAKDLQKLMNASVPEELRAPSHLEVGPPLANICDHAAMNDIDLIICGRHGRGWFPGTRLGSVAEGIARHAPCPVLVVPSVTR
jgi:nucleotide-binding universal stress UspA family protein